MIPITKSNKQIIKKTRSMAPNSLMAAKLAKNTLAKNKKVKSKTCFNFASAKLSLF